MHANRGVKIPANAPFWRTRVSKLVAFGTFRILASGVIQVRLTRLRLPPRERPQSGDSGMVWHAQVTLRIDPAAL